MVPQHVQAITCNFEISPNPPTVKASRLDFAFTSPDIADALKGIAAGGDLQFVFPETKRLISGYACGPFSLENTASVPSATVTETNRASFNGQPLTTYLNWHWFSGADGDCNKLFTQDIEHAVELHYGDASLCQGKYIIRSKNPTCDITYDFTHSAPPVASDGTVDDPGWKITVSNVANTGPFDARVYVKIDTTWLPNQARTGVFTHDPPYTFPLPAELRTVKPNPHTITAYIGNDFSYSPCDTRPLPISASGEANVCANQPETTLPDGITTVKVTSCDGAYAKYAGCPWCPSTGKLPSEIIAPEMVELCNQLPDKYKGSCWTCANKSNEKTHYIWTAIGCLPTDYTYLINAYILTYGIGIAGGIAFLRFLYGAFLILTSGGNAEALEEAKQIITSSIIGLLIVIFSVFFLQTMGVDILQLPNFKSSGISAGYCPGTNDCTSAQVCKEVAPAKFVCVPK